MGEGLKVGEGGKWVRDGKWEVGEGGKWVKVGSE